MNGRFLLDTNIIISLFAKDPQIHDRMGEKHEGVNSLIVTKKGMPETSFNTTEAQTYGKQSRFISDSIDHDSTVSPPHYVI